MKLSYRFNKPKYLYEVKNKKSNSMGDFFTTRNEAREVKNTKNSESTGKYVIYRHEINMTSTIIR